MKILIIEDNVKLAEYIKIALEEEKYIVDIVNDGTVGQNRVENNNYDLIVLDIMLPGQDGIALCNNLRKKKINIPIIMTSALGETENKIDGLNIGADDYLTKPFEIVELIARIKALLRRPQKISSKEINYKDLTVNISEHTVFLNKKEIYLTEKEYMVLEYLLVNKGMVLSRAQILNHCWDFAFDTFSNIVDVYIKQIRKKIGNEKYIKTIRGIGYKI